LRWWRWGHRRFLSCHEGRWRWGWRSFTISTWDGIEGPEVLEEVAGGGRGGGGGGPFEGVPEAAVGALLEERGRGRTGGVAIPVAAGGGGGGGGGGAAQKICCFAAPEFGSGGGGGGGGGVCEADTL
jgi:hypothetical protein